MAKIVRADVAADVGQGIAVFVLLGPALGEAVLQIRYSGDETLPCAVNGDQRERAALLGSEGAAAAFMRSEEGTQRRRSEEGAQASLGLDRKSVV